MVNGGSAWAVGFRKIHPFTSLKGLITGDKSVGSHIELLGRTVSAKAAWPAISAKAAPTPATFPTIQPGESPERTGERADWRLGSTPFWRTCFSYFTREQKHARYRR